jgi:hypothetical protein
MAGWSNSKTKLKQDFTVLVGERGEGPAVWKGSAPWLSGGVVEDVHFVGL